jgi:hypothetical protein
MNREIGRRDLPPVINVCALLSKVLNVVHSLGEDTRSLFQGFETAKQILTKSVMWKWRGAYSEEAAHTLYLSWKGIRISCGSTLKAET